VLYDLTRKESFIQGKLCLRYVGPFQVIGIVGPVAYRVELLSSMTGIHDVFHVSQLQKCVHDPFAHNL
jgi:hypothetical protein